MIIDYPTVLFRVTFKSYSATLLVHIKKMNKRILQLYKAKVRRNEYVSKHVNIDLPNVLLTSRKMAL